MQPQRHRPLRPERLRKLEPPFCWVPFRFLSSGWFQRLGPTACLLYFVLCLAADRQGISFYGDARLCRLLGVSAAELKAARRELCHLDLLAFDGSVYQLLSLPAQEAMPRREPLQTTKTTPAAEERWSRNAEHIREILRRLSGER